MEGHLHSQSTAPNVNSGTVVKNLPANAGDTGSTLGREDPLEEEMATHSSILAWKSYGQRSLEGYNGLHGTAKGWTLTKHACGQARRHEDPNPEGPFVPSKAEVVGRLTRDISGGFEALPQHRVWTQTTVCGLSRGSTCHPSPPPHSSAAPGVQASDVSLHWASIP